jgi:ribA/ribD-fused uncharacterized protein
MTIKFWGADKPNGFLSNFYKSPFQLENLRYPTVEHYFQSKKFEGTRFEYYILSLETPIESAREGKRRDLPLRSDWEEVKEQVMYKALRAKFLSHRALFDSFMATGDQDLVENSPFDYYWGTGRDDSGKNRLGILLMRLRKEFQDADSN